MDLVDIERLVSAGESETLELKQSTGQLTRAAQALCGFLNGRGGIVLIGVTPDGRIVGQRVADKTQQDVAGMIRQFEPPAPIDMERIALPGSNLEVIALRAIPAGETTPFTFDGRPYQRLGTTTVVMPQERYLQLLLDRVHSRRRWENAPATDVPAESLDRGDCCANHMAASRLSWTGR